MSTSNAISSIQTQVSGLQLRATIAPNEQQAGVDAATANATRQVVASQAEQAPNKNLEPVNGSALQQMAEAVNKINGFLQAEQRDLQFSLDKDTGETVVKIVDSKTHQVIRQIPSETMLHLAKEFDKLKGLLFEERA